MLKVKKNKILVSLVAIIMVVLVVGNIYSLATENEGTGGAIGLTETNKTNTNKSANTNKASNNTANTNSDGNLGAEVGATNTNRNSNTKKASNNTSNTNNASKNSTKNTNAATSNLPYAGSNTSIIFIVIALGASAVYAYKKVSDYNI